MKPESGLICFTNRWHNLYRSFHVLIIFAFSIIFFTNTFAQINENLKFRRYGIVDGLSQSTINSVIQDNKGYIWIGTQDGLNRYDGYSFAIFKHNLEDSTSITNNYVWSLFQDKEDRIWVGTNGGGLDLFDPKTQKFTHFRHDPHNTNSISGDIVWSILQDELGMIWLGTDQGLNLFDPSTKRFTHFKHDPNDINSITTNRVRCVYRDTENKIWVGTDDGGLNLFDPETQRFIHYKNDPNDSNSLSDNDIRCIYQDNQDRIWIGTYGGGLNLFNSENQSFTHFKNESQNPNSLSNNDVYCILQDSQNKLWVGTYGGLNLFDHTNKKFTHVQHDRNNPNSLSNNNIWSIFQDKENRLWIGTLSGGLNFLDPLTLSFNHFGHDDRNPLSLSDNNVLSILEDRHNRVWVGTFGGGLNLFNPKNQSFTHYKHDSKDLGSISSNIVVNIFQDRKNRIWIGTHGGGLNLFDSITHTFTHFKPDSENSKSLSHNSVINLSQDSEDRIWVATFGGGINRFDPQTQSFTHFKHDTNNPNSLSGNQVPIVYHDRQCRIWIGTDGGGLNLFDPVTETFTHFKHDPKNPNSISSNIVFSIYQDSQDRIWVGTSGGGINLMEPNNGTFKAWREKEGLSNNVVYGVLEDGIGNLFISTNKGINKFNPKTEEFIWYGKEDGLQSDEFWSGAYHKGKDGRMYFGGVNGLTVFDPEAIKNNLQIPPVVINNFLLFNKSIIISDSTVLNQAPDYVDKITLGHNDYIFAFEFSALNYRQPEKNQFAYKLEGFSEAWIYTDYKDRKATYTNVPAGTYTFRVKASNDDGYWNEEGASIKVIILPPWWLTWWAKTLWVGIFVAFLLTFYKLRTRSLKAQKKKLQLQVNERTHEVVQQKEEIQAQSEELKATNEQLMELGEFKDAMTGMIVHDFKNDLNTVISFSDGKPTESRLKSIKSASRHMLNMALNMLDVQKFEEAEVSLALSNNAIPKMINETLEQVSFLLEQKSIKLTYKLPDNLFSNCDLGLINRVITNLLTNAIKYTPANSSIHIKAEEQDEFVKLHVQDNGLGIPKDKLDTIFEKFAQVDGKKSGEVSSTGLGLTFCKMVVEAHNGEIGVESIEGNGSTFWFTIPKSEIQEDIKLKKIDISLQVPAEIVNELSEKDKALLQPYLEQLLKYEVYDYSDVKDILETISTNGNSSIVTWLEEMQKALQNVNEEVYMKLINSVNGK